MDIKVCIAEIPIAIELEDTPVITEGFEEFLYQGDEKYRCCFHSVNQLPTFAEKEYICRDFVTDIIRDTDDSYIRIYYTEQKNGHPYAVRTTDYRNNRVDIRYLAEDGKYLSELHSAFYHVVLDEIMMREHRMILHSSFVHTPYGGLLFIGRSGIGKSTQADLWVRYGNARILNGDRTICHRTGADWIGYGSPFAGSSGYYVNESADIKAIVVLDQGDTDSLVRLQPSKAFQSIYAQTTVNAWNPTYVNGVCEMIGQMVMELPVYYFSCTPTETAVKVVEQMLKDGDSYEAG